MGSEGTLKKGRGTREEVEDPDRSVWRQGTSEVAEGRVKWGNSWLHSSTNSSPVIECVFVYLEITLFYEAHICHIDFEHFSY